MKNSIFWLLLFEQQVCTWHTVPYLIRYVLKFEGSTVGTAVLVSRRSLGRINPTGTNSSWIWPPMNLSKKSKLTTSHWIFLFPYISNLLGQKVATNQVEQVAQNCPIILLLITFFFFFSFFAIFFRFSTCRVYCDWTYFRLKFTLIHNQTDTFEKKNGKGEA